MFWKCKHPAASLRVDKGATTEREGADFDIVTYHLFCCRCSERVTIKHAVIRGGVEGFLARGRVGSNDGFSREPRSGESAGNHS